MFIITADYSLFVLLIFTISIASTVYDSKSESAEKSECGFFLILFFSWLVHTSVHSMLNFSCRRMAHRFFAEEKLQRFDIG